MASVGTLGSHAFYASANAIKTFQSIKWDSSARYAEHQRHLGESLLELVGIDPDNLTLEMELSAFLGVDPLEEIDDLQRDQRRGKKLSLRIGGEKIGKSRWVIVKISNTLKQFDRRGNVLSAKVSVTLKSCG